MTVPARTPTYILHTPTYYQALFELPLVLDQCSRVMGPVSFTGSMLKKIVNGPCFRDTLGSENVEKS